MFFLFLTKTYCGYSLEVPQRGTSNEYPQYVLQEKYKKYQGQVVQNIVSLTSSLVVKMLTALVSTISNSQVFLLKKCELLLQMQLKFFQQNY